MAKITRRQAKTINLDRNAKAEDLSPLLQEYIHDLKGVTVYRDGSKDEQPLNRLTEEEALKHLESITTDKSEDDVKCANGKCDI